MIHQLKADGLNHSQIARRLNLDRKTVRWYLSSKPSDTAEVPRKARPSKLDRYRGHLLRRVTEHPQLCATLKREWVQDRCFETIDELRVELRSYIDGFYNARRLHSSLGYVSPNEYEAGFQKSDLSGASPRQVRSHGLAQTYV